MADIRNGRRILTPKQEEEIRKTLPDSLILSPGSLAAGIRRLSVKDLATALPAEQVHQRTVICSGCSVPFKETIIVAAGENPKPRDKDERPDLCANCFNALNRFPIIGAKKPRGRDVPRRI
jgi:hypothetical protein